MDQERPFFLFIYRRQPRENPRRHGKPLWNGYEFSGPARFFIRKIRDLRRSEDGIALCLCFFVRAARVEGPPEPALIVLLWPGRRVGGGGRFPQARFGELLLCG